MSNPDLNAVRAFGERVRESVERAIVGKSDVIRMVIAAVVSGGHVLFEDYPGLGKTLLARTLAQSTELAFARIQFTPDLLPGDITGGTVYNRETGAFELHRGPIFTNILLADEINRASPKTQSALLEAMQEGQVTIEGETILLPDPFVVLATQNPIEYEGTFPLPEAQLDRFLMRLSLGYPATDDEIQILRNLRKHHPIETIEQVVDGEQISILHEVVTDVHVDESLERYVLDIVQATRDHPDLALGASPRGSLALYKTSQALAAVNRRDYVIPDDVKTLVPVTLAHRLIVEPESELRGHTAQGILCDVLERTELDIGELS